MDTVWNIFVGITVPLVEFLVYIWRTVTFHSAAGSIVVALLGVAALVWLAKASKGDNE